MKHRIDLKSGQVVERSLTPEEASDRAISEAAAVTEDAALRAQVERQEKREQALEALLEEENKKPSARKEIKDYAGLKVKR